VAQGLAPDPTTIKPQGIQDRGYYNYLTNITMDTEITLFITPDGRIYVVTANQWPVPLYHPGSPLSPPPPPPNTPERRELENFVFCTRQCLVLINLISFRRTFSERLLVDQRAFPSQWIMYIRI
jgi:hypothetical protein